MLVSDILIRVQRTFGDEDEVQVTTEDVIRWINDAQREVVMQHEGLLQTDATLATVVDQLDYTLPTDVFALKFVYYKDQGSYYQVKYLTAREFAEYLDGWDGTRFNSGVPRVYTSPTNGEIVLFPKPDTSDATGLKLNYSRYPTDLTVVEDEIGLPTYYHSYVEHFCMMKAYEMDEDWEAADRKAAILQSTIDFNTHREGWFGKDEYPAVTPLAEDSM